VESGARIIDVTRIGRQGLECCSHCGQDVQPAKDEAGERRAPIPARFVFAADTADGWAKS